MQSLRSICSFKRPITCEGAVENGEADMGELGKEIIYLGDMCPEMGLSVAEYIYFEFYS